MKNFTSGGATFFLGVPRGTEWPDLKNRKILIQNGGLNPQPKFQHSSWIRKCLKIRDFWGGFRPPHWGWGVQFQKFEKSLIQNGGLNLQPKFQHPSSIRKCLKQIEEVKMFVTFVTREQKLTVLNLSSLWLYVLLPVREMY